MMNFIENSKRFLAVTMQLQKGGRKQIAKIFVGLGFIIVCTSTAAQNDTDGAWTLPRLISFALENNKQIEANELVIKNREQSVLVVFSFQRKESP